ncbi:MAG TPA: hypothetical protein VI504_07145 [Candidatus Eisenbacteria bacterium]|jgi:uncharacterized protein YndB with AHSA1/START domain
MDKALKYALVTVGALVGAGVLAVLLGLMLPRRHVAVTTAVLDRPVGEVWLAISDMESQAAWRSDLKGVKRLPDHAGHPVWMQKTDMGDWPLEVTEVSPPVWLVAAVADSSQGFGGTWTYELLALRAGTRVTITERGFIDSPFYRFLAWFVFGLHASQETFLRDLGRHFGESVKPMKQV